MEETARERDYRGRCRQALPETSPGDVQLLLQEAPSEGIAVIASLVAIPQDPESEESRKAHTVDEAYGRAAPAHLLINWHE
ncbi:hypothetical protein FOCC_FOCC001453 [Frankliniella occidentalis]|nr:hypothetical protein FOCC_FOCC001453 [Frankliniella occidentalis]